MRIAVFPFETTRDDDLQGVYARQVPRRLAAGLRDAGLDARPLSWLARRGDRWAHVVIEAPLPRDVVVEEAATADASHTLLGRVHVRVASAELELHLSRTAALDEPWVWRASRPGDELDLLVHDGLCALLTELGRRPPEAPEAPLPLQALTEALVDADNTELVERGGLTSLRDEDDAWRHLVRAQELGDVDIAQVRVVEDRVLGWLADRRYHLALRALTGLARLLPADEERWGRVVALGETLEAWTEVEEALRTLTVVGRDLPRAHVALGVFLLQQQRAAEAVAEFTQAVDAPELRDAAETYLGLSLAAMGEVTRAIEHWRRVASSGSDTRMVRIAREQLARAER